MWLPVNALQSFALLSVQESSSFQSYCQILLAEQEHHQELGLGMEVLHLSWSTGRV